MQKHKNMCSVYQALNYATNINYLDLRLTFNTILKLFELLNTMPNFNQIFGGFTFSHHFYIQDKQCKMMRKLENPFKKTSSAQACAEKT